MHKPNNTLVAPPETHTTPTLATPELVFYDTFESDDSRRFALHERYTRQDQQTGEDRTGQAVPLVDADGNTLDNPWGDPNVRVIIGLSNGETLLISNEVVVRWSPDGRAGTTDYYNRDAMAGMQIVLGESFSTDGRVREDAPVVTEVLVGGSLRTDEAYAKQLSDLHQKSVRFDEKPELDPFKRFDEQIAASRAILEDRVAAGAGTPPWVARQRTRV